MNSTLSVRCIPRGPSVVEHGVLAVEWRIDDGGEEHRINIKALQAQIDNTKQDPKYTEGAVEHFKAMDQFDKMLDDCVSKGMKLCVVGDVTGFNYYLALARKKNIFDRRWAHVKTIHPGFEGN
jgi:hypothetical protein